MRRRIAGITALLIAGAAVNVAVAWGFNLLPYSSGGETYLPDSADLDWWVSNAPPGFPANPAGVHETQGFGRSISMMYEHETDTSGNSLGDNVGHFQYGWPCLSMESSIWIDRRNRIAINQNRFLIPNGWLGAGTWISTKPNWPGFLANTLFYAAILWGLFFTLGQVWRTLRRRRGLCPACAYPIGASPVCTECGAKVTVAKT